MITVKQQLFALQDPGYRAFHRKLLPTLPPDAVIGVRTPQLRALAKSLAGSPEAAAFMRELPHRYYEENTLHGCLIERIGGFAPTIEELERFLPYIDNWATCDLLRPRVFARSHASLLPYAEKWLSSDHPYTVRYAIEMLMVHFLEADFRPAYPAAVAAIHSDHYYVQMMAAWYFATALAIRYDDILPYLAEDGRLMQLVRRMAVRKALDSRRITPAQKAFLRENCGGR